MARADLAGVKDSCVAHRLLAKAMKYSLTGDGIKLSNLNYQQTKQIKRSPFDLDFGLLLILFKQFCLI